MSRVERLFVLEPNGLERDLRAQPGDVRAGDVELRRRGDERLLRDLDLEPECVDRGRSGVTLRSEDLDLRVRRVNDQLELFRGGLRLGTFLFELGHALFGGLRLFVRVRHARADARHTGQDEQRDAKNTTKGHGGNGAPRCVVPVLAIRVREAPI